MKPKQPPTAKTAIDHVRALLSALNKSEFWTPRMNASYREAVAFLARKGKGQ